MASADVAYSPATEKKRRRDDDDEHLHHREHTDKKSRPTLVSPLGPSDQLWHPHDSVTSSPAHRYHKQQSKYDSDDQSSMVSEPGSPQALSTAGDSDSDVAMNSDDEADSADAAAFSQSPEDSPLHHAHGSKTPRSPWRAGRSMQTANRVPTPMVHPSYRPSAHPLQSHMRSRHPQEFLSSDRLDVPSPVDEDEVPTPPSAAEAAGSQLELLTVSDIEMHHDGLQGVATPTGPPRVLIGQSEPSLRLDGSGEGSPDQDEADDLMDVAPEAIIVRKQRARSGALSAGGNSSLRDSPGPNGHMDGAGGLFGGKRGFSMGFRADCEKCRMKVPGHLNHFF